VPRAGAPATTDDKVPVVAVDEGLGRPVNAPTPLPLLAPEPFTTKGRPALQFVRRISVLAAQAGSKGSPSA